jgi:glutamate transport system substrate-binding protein
MKRSRTATALTAIAAVAALTLSACQADTGGDGETPSSSSATDSASVGGGSIRIGIKFDQPGLGYQDGSEYTGFDVDVATYVAEKLGYSADQITWVEAPSAQRETMLENGQVDMIFATYSITDERDKVVDFAGPYFVAGQDLLVRSDDTSITGPDDLNGKNLCSVSGSTSAQRIKDDYADQVQLIEQPGYSECIQFLVQGQVDAVTTDDIILAGLAANEGSGALKVVGNPFSEEQYGVGIPEGSDQCGAIDDAITAMVDDGSLETFIKKNTEGIAYTPNADLNPPKLRECSA